MQGGVFSLPLLPSGGTSMLIRTLFFGPPEENKKHYNLDAGPLTEDG